jgi:chromosome partitioning protein
MRLRRRDRSESEAPLQPAAVPLPTAPAMPEDEPAPEVAQPVPVDVPEAELAAAADVDPVAPEPQVSDVLVETEISVLTETITTEGTVEIEEISVVEIAEMPVAHDASPPSARAQELAADDLMLPQRPEGAIRTLPRVLAVANQKGGVGKTTTTVNLGAALAELGYRVLVVDLDPQGNATTGLGIDARHFEQSMYDVIMRGTDLEDCIEPTSVKHLFVAPATIDLAGVEIELVPAFSRELKLKRAIDSVVEDFDFVLIDCPPSLGLITINGLAAASEVLVPIQCEYYALEGLSQLLRNVRLVATNLNTNLEVSTIVLTMYDARTRLALEVANEVREHFPSQVCKTVIPRTIRLSEAPSFGQPITVFDPSSRGAVAYRSLAEEVSHGAPKRAG